MWCKMSYANILVLYHLKFIQQWGRCMGIHLHNFKLENQTYIILYYMFAYSNKNNVTGIDNHLFKKVMPILW